jgi:hypothetical protein
MNTLQNILKVIALMYFKQFEGGFTPEEDALILRIKTSQNIKYLRVENGSHGKMLLVWESAIHMSVACPIKKKRLRFSEVARYKYSSSTPKEALALLLVNEPEKKKIVDKEIEEIKKMFMSYSIDAEFYFKEEEVVVV